MGFFDKLKASVGVGGAKVELVAPVAVCSGESLPLQIIVRGGDLEQKLNGLDVTVGVSRTNPDQSKQEPSTKTHFSARIEVGSQSTIAKKAELRFEGRAEIPLCQTLYIDDPERYATLVVASDDTEDPTRWEAEGPLPFMDGWEMDTVSVSVSADIPGAIDPSADQRVHVLPEAAGSLRRTGPLGEEQITERLRAAQAERVFVSNASDNWIVWWSRGDGRVVGWARLAAAAMVRPEGVVRGYTNPRIPAASVLAKQASDVADQIPGEMDEAHEWTKKLAAEAGLDGVLSRPVGNAFFALRDLHLV